MAAQLLLMCGSVACSDFTSDVAVDVSIDPTTLLSFGESASPEFDRAQFVNIHSSPGSAINWRPQDIARYASQLDTNLGRSFLVSGAMMNSKEDATRPGFVDHDSLLSWCKQHGPTLGGWPAKQVDIIVSSKAEQLSNETAAKGFVPGSAKATAEFFSLYLQHCAPSWQDRYLVEVANECNVKTSELHMSWDELCDLHAAVAAQIHADANTTLNSTKQYLVGGPTIAYPEFQLKSFQNFLNGSIGRFIERAGQSIDFISLHLYDSYTADPLPAPADPREYTPRTGNNVEAILDLIEAWSIKVLGHALPLVVSEYGSTEKQPTPYSAQHNWFVLRGAIGKLMSFVNRPDRILKAVPFIVDKATWFPDANGSTPYPFVLWRRQPGTSGKSTVWLDTELSKFYELLNGVGGARLLASTSNENVQVAAFTTTPDGSDSNSSSLLVCLNNLLNATTKVRLSTAIGIPEGSGEGEGTDAFAGHADLGHLAGYSCTSTRLYWGAATGGGAPGVQLERSQQPQPMTTAIELVPEEALVLNCSSTLVVPAIRTTAKQMQMRAFYATQVLVPIMGSEQVLTIPTAMDDIGILRAGDDAGRLINAWLRLSFSTPDNSSAAQTNVHQGPSLAINGNQSACEPYDRARHVAGREHFNVKTGEFFGSANIPCKLPLGTFYGGEGGKEVSGVGVAVAVQFPKAGGSISSAVLSALLPASEA
eukprot:g2191.t1